MKRLSVIFNGLFKYLYIIITCVILLACMLGSNTSYYLKKGFLLNNFWCLAAGICVILLFCLFSHCVIRYGKLKITGKQVMLFWNMLFGMLLIVLTYHYYFKTGWDAIVVIENAERIAHGDFASIDQWYFSRCTNNIFITCIFAAVIRLGELLPFGNAYFYLIVLQCFISAYTGYMTYAVAEMYCKKTESALLAWLIYVLLAGLSPLTVVPYTDTVAVFFLITIVYLYSRRCHPFWIGLFFTTGYYVKPQIVILGIAIVLLEGHLLVASARTKWKKMLTVFLGIMAGILLVKGSAYLSHIQADSARSLGVSHYLMLGLNERTNGVFAEEDLLFSESFNSVQERSKANLEEAGKRLTDMGAAGLAKHLGRKLQTTFNDGSFAWAAEGGFFQEMVYSGNAAVREFLQNIYYPEGKYYAYFLLAVQILWMGVLFFAVLGVDGKEQGLLVMALSLIGLTMFEMIFEPRARHVLIYVPVYIVLACRGVERLQSAVCSKRTFSIIHHAWYTKKRSRKNME